jgi:ERCC4-type nuclease
MFCEYSPKMNVSFLQSNAVFDMISRRIKNNFEPSPLTVGALAKIPDWSCPETGLPGAASAKQILERKATMDLAKSIYEAAMLVHQANHLKIKT